MTHVFIAALLVSAVIPVQGADGIPERPTAVQVAAILGIDRSRVSAVKLEQNRKLDGKVLWMAAYQVTGEQDCSLTITLVPDNRLKTAFIEKIGGNQKISRDDGDVIYHGFGDRGDQGTYYMTTLINHENDWDMTLMLYREPGVDESKLPFAIAKDGVKLIGEFEGALRKLTAQQGGADQPATAPESKSEGEQKPKPESEGRSQ